MLLGLKLQTGLEWNELLENFHSWSLYGSEEYNWQTAKSQVVFDRHLGQNW